MTAPIRSVPPGSAANTDDALEWLAGVGAPFRVEVPGEDPGRTRVITTLLHGNEPSGVRALHRWLRRGDRPAVRLVAFVLSVPAALGPPPFARRAPSGHRDLNRCFDSAEEEPASALAGQLLGQIRELRPEVLVDLHNTSARGLAYAVVTRDDPQRRALTASFASRMVVTDLRLGSLTEAIEREIPSIVVECGGRGDPVADEVAFAGIERLVSGRDGDAADVTVLRHPLRVEIDPTARLQYDREPGAAVDITLDEDIARHNFAPAPAGTRLGWLGPLGLAALRVRRGDGREARGDLLEAIDGELRLRCDAQILMATADPGVARDDCAFYAVPLGS